MPRYSPPAEPRVGAESNQTIGLAMLKRLLKTARPENQSERLDHLLIQCKMLIAEQGDVETEALAMDALATYDRLSAPVRQTFFEHLADDFGPDPGEIASLARRFAHSEAPQDLIALRVAMESPRTSLLRRLNRAPGGTAAIVGMRAELLKSHQQSPHLCAFSDEIRSLLQLWFDPGFLRLERVDWQSPAALLDQLIEFEAVHQIDGWSDVRRRLDSDRRCYAFFHPVMPQAPLFFVEVALLESMPNAIAPLLDRRQSPVEKGVKYRTAAFYSISNCQPGLRGVQLGSSLVQQVTAALRVELPDLDQFCTLSPVPGFSSWLKTVNRLDSTTLKPTAVQQLNQDLDDLRKRFGPDLAGLIEIERNGQYGQANTDRMAPSADDHSPASARTKNPARRLEDQSGGRSTQIPDSGQHCAAPAYEKLRRLCAFYLVEARVGMTKIVDDEARFHLRNGASLDQINVRANLSETGFEQSFGLMANYSYRLKDIDRNHQAALRGQVSTSRQVSGLLKSLRVVR